LGRVKLGTQALGSAGVSLFTSGFSDIDPYLTGFSP
jgi:hypothetical protein